jgi:hypothetical protein
LIAKTKLAIQSSSDASIEKCQAHTAASSASAVNATQAIVTVSQSTIIAEVVNS